MGAVTPAWQRREFIQQQRAEGFALQHCVRLWAQRPDVAERKRIKEEKSAKWRQRRLNKEKNVKRKRVFCTSHQIDSLTYYVALRCHITTFLLSDRSAAEFLLLRVRAFCDSRPIHIFDYHSAGSMKRSFEAVNELPDPWSKLPDPWSSLPDPVSETSLPDPWQSGSQASRPAGNVKPKQRVSVESGKRLLAASTQKVKLNKFEQAGSDVEKIKQRRAQGCEGCQAGAIPFLNLKTLCQSYQLRGEGASSAVYIW